MLGFVPESSVVVVMCSSGEGDRSSIGPLMRLDSDQVSQLAPCLRQFRAQHPQYDEAMIVTYEPALRDAERWAEASCAVARDAGFHVVDALATGHGRWRSVLCANPACCPPVGNELPADQPAAIALRAERVASGQVTVASRAELVALVEPAGEQIDPHLLADACRRRRAEIQRDGASAWRDRIVKVLAEHVEAVATGATPNGLDADTPALLDALDVYEVRDTICGWLTKTELRPAIVEVMLRLARASQHHVANPLCVAALHAYADGNGALANVCLDRAYGLQPDHTLTKLLDHFIRSGAHPSTLTRIVSPRSGD
jgi:hypothetical protein